ncbi:MAG: phosphotyrosine protein phosphatase [Candidatus Competibacteraceae bacterium]|nr:phosphotyrosine protein phosphatase [Candidatus Competibacteraceae bacterium]
MDQESLALKRVLFLCSQNKLRSPTAERVFSNWSELIVASAGFNHDAEVKVNADDVAGSDLIFVMEKSHEEKLKSRFKSHLAGVQVICLDIPDQYDYMDPELVKILLEKVPPYLK